MSQCPVCKWEIKDDGLAVRIDGKDIMVCCQECADKLRKDPKIVSTHKGE